MKENNGHPLFAEERRSRIVEYITERQQVTVDELCEAFGVSPATVRNDLNSLHNEGKIRRTHGGAVANSRVDFELLTEEKTQRNLEAKKAIAQEAVKYIHEGDSIALDCGTTIFELAKLLTRFRDLHVITYDLPIAAWLYANTEHSVFVIGGEIRRGHHYMLGGIFRDCLPRLNVDRFFMAANAIDPVRGITTPHMETAMLKEQIRLGSSQVILLSDSSKLGKVSFAKYADLQDVDAFITDDRTSQSIVDRIRAEGTNVILAKTQSEIKTP